MANTVQGIGEYLVFGVLAAFFILAALSAYRRREELARTARWLVVMLASSFLAFLIAKQFTPDQTKALLIALLVEFMVGLASKPKRKSRYISRVERRKAIARYERTGRRYDPRRHHLDHVVPHSRGGSNKADNLRVLESEENLTKSAKAPWWDVFSR